MEHLVKKIIPKEKKVLIQAGNNSFEKYYSKLLIATGAGARKIDFKNGDLKNIHTLRNLTDGIKITSSLGAVSSGVTGGSMLFSATSFLYEHPVKDNMIINNIKRIFFIKENLQAYFL